MWSRPISANTSSRSAARRRATSSRRPFTCAPATSPTSSAAAMAISPPGAICPRPRRWSGKRAACCARSFSGADVGITGANFLVAETGSAIVVTNEGNADLTMSLPKVHIVLASIDKVVPTLNDALAAAAPLGALGDGAGVHRLHDAGHGAAPRRRRRRSRGLPRRHRRQRPRGLVALEAAAGAALHPLRRLHEPLPGLLRHRRPRLRLGVSRPHRRGAGAGPGGHARRPGIWPRPPPSAAAARRCAPSRSRSFR